MGIVLVLRLVSSVSVIAVQYGMVRYRAPPLKSESTVRYDRSLYIFSRRRFTCTCLLQTFLKGSLLLLLVHIVLYGLYRSSVLVPGDPDVHYGSTVYLIVERTGHV